MKVSGPAQRVRSGILTLLIATAAASQLPAQVVVPCDFDIADEIGRFMTGRTLRLAGTPGGPSTRGEFIIINGNTAEMDVDRDGFAAPGTCNYNNIFVPTSLKSNLVNVDNNALAIPAENVIVTNLPRRLGSGTSANANVFIAIPTGTPAGRYIGSFQVRDSVILSSRAGNNNNVDLSVDEVYIELVVSEQRGLGVVNPDSAVRLDSVVVRGRAGTRASSTFRVANLGNISLADVRLAATDLRSESAVGIIIPSQSVTFSPPSLASIARGDTARITVTVAIPRGILGGRYRGSILVQGSDAAAVQIPLIVIVTSSRGIAFENNPVTNSNGGLARIAFNADPGTTYKVAIFDVAGLTTFTTEGQVFAGISTTGTPGTVEAPASGADFAVNVLWPLRNGRGEGVASGLYIVVVESIVNGERVLARDKLIVIR